MVKPDTVYRLLSLSVVALVLVITFTGCITIPPQLFAGTRGPVKVEVLEPAKGFAVRDQILLLDLTGLVTVDESRGMFSNSPGMLVGLMDRLKAAEDNKNIKAVILRIDSPGGGVTASDLIYHEILRFKKKTRLPVVAMMQDIAASGGLYVAMAADEIYALPTTVTGSIGVITVLPKLEGLGGKIGLEMRVIKSGSLKDMGSPWRDLTTEEQQLLQGLINDMYEQFLKVVLDSRGPKGLTREKLATIADGRVFVGQKAVDAGLIDGVMYPEKIIERARQLGKAPGAAVISYVYPYDYRGNMYAASVGAQKQVSLGHGGDINLMKLDLGTHGVLPSDTRFLYLWLP